MKPMYRRLDDLTGNTQSSKTTETHLSKLFQRTKREPNMSIGFRYWFSLTFGLTRQREHTGKTNKTRPDVNWTDPQKHSAEDAMCLTQAFSKRLQARAFLPSCRRNREKGMCTARDQLLATNLRLVCVRVRTKHVLTRMGGSVVQRGHIRAITIVTHRKQKTQSGPILRGPDCQSLGKPGLRGGAPCTKRTSLPLCSQGRENEIDFAFLPAFGPFREKLLLQTGLLPSLWRITA